MGKYTITDDDGEWEPCWLAENFMFTLIGVCLGVVSTLAVQGWW